VSFWIGVVNNNNGNREAALNGFEASSEFQTLTAVLFGSATGDDQRTDQFINNLYLATTGAAATPTQLQQQRNRLNAEAAQGLVFVKDEAEEIGRELFASQVTNFSISEVQFVTNLYEGFLQRGPDTSGLNFWVNEAGTNNSTKRQNVLTSFAESGPFKDLAGTLYREVFWLIPDHLGTPRMLVNRTGSLGGVKRHDYLPFGEELFATVGGRTVALGFWVKRCGNNSRQRSEIKKRRWIFLGRDIMGHDKVVLLPRIRYWKAPIIFNRRVGIVIPIAEICRCSSKILVV
jgi:hypothetical protein